MVQSARRLPLETYPSLGYRGLTFAQIPAGLDVPLAIRRQQDDPRPFAAETLSLRLAPLPLQLLSLPLILSDHSCRPTHKEN